MMAKNIHVQHMQHVRPRCAHCDLLQRNSMQSVYDPVGFGLYLGIGLHFYTLFSLLSMNCLDIQWCGSTCIFFIDESISWREMSFFFSILEFHLLPFLFNFMCTTSGLVCLSWRKDFSPAADAQSCLSFLFSFLFFLTMIMSFFWVWIQTESVRSEDVVGKFAILWWDKYTVS